MARIEVPRETKTISVGQNIRVVGTIYRADEIRSFGDIKHQDVTLIPEPNNPHDRNAISVRYQGTKIGYLSEYWAKRYAPKIHAIFIAGYLPTAYISEANGIDLKISIAKPHEIYLSQLITNPKKRYKIPKTYNVPGEFPLLVKAPKEKGKRKGLFSFLKRK